MSNSFKAGVQTDLFPQPVEKEYVKKEEQMVVTEKNPIIGFIITLFFFERKREEPQFKIEELRKHLGTTMHRTQQFLHLMVQKGFIKRVNAYKFEVCLPTELKITCLESHSSEVLIIFEQLKQERDGLIEKLRIEKEMTSTWSAENNPPEV